MKSENRKTLYFIGGTMGVGKSTVCQELKRMLPGCVFLDGDWCWDAHPFIVSDETREMVIRNICFLLNSFLSCSVYQNVVFCWVMDRQEILNSIMEKLDLEDVEVIPISLVCSPKTLIEHLDKDIRNGIRSEDILKRSLERLPLYDELETVKLDVTGKNVQESAELILSLAGKPEIEQ